MKLNEEQIRHLISEFLVRVKPDTIEAVVLTMTEQLGITQAARKYKISTQAIHFNTNRVNDLCTKINIAYDLLHKE